MATITIAGFDLYPETIKPRLWRIGGPTRRSLDGTGYQKNITQKQKLALSWSVLESDEYQLVRIIWEQARQGMVAISCINPLVSGNFLCADEELAFEPIEGDGNLWRGSINFEER